MTQLYDTTEYLFEQVTSTENLRQAFSAVKRNKGAAGVDGQTIAQFEDHLEEELAQLSTELRDWSYVPSPVRRVEIPKPGTQGKMRSLGIPTIRDRVLQTSIKFVLEPILEVEFSDHSYGFRPGRNQHQAIERAQRYVQEGKVWVCDLDLAEFFDRIPHDRLVARLSQKIFDKRILRLIGNTLRSGVMARGCFQATDEGAVQGSPLSPLLSNFVLDEFDKELEKRGLSFVRFADDANILVRSREAAERVLQSVTRYLETKLKLKVNREKSKAVAVGQSKFLGVTIVGGEIAIARKSMVRAMEKITTLIPRRSHQSLEQTMATVNLWYKGWSNYFAVTQFPNQFATLEAHIRRRLRCRIAAAQKKRRNLIRKLIKRGVKRATARRSAGQNKGWWYLSHTRGIEQAYPNEWFRMYLGQYQASTLQLPHWHTVKVRAKLL